jgi:antitoxin CptB
MTNPDVLPRLRWACRRGMLELDVLLGNFLEEAFLKLLPQDQAFFIQLLDSNDQELFLWLTGKETPTDPDLIHIVERVRQHAKQRH